MLTIFSGEFVVNMVKYDRPFICIWKDKHA